MKELMSFQQLLDGYWSWQCLSVVYANVQKPTNRIWEKKNFMWHHRGGFPCPFHAVSVLNQSNSGIPGPAPTIPDPVLPTMPTFSLGRMEQETLLRTRGRFSWYFISTSLNTSSPCLGHSGGGDRPLTRAGASWVRLCRTSRTRTLLMVRQPTIFLLSQLFSF